MADMLAEEGANLTQDTAFVEWIVPSVFVWKKLEADMEGTNFDWHSVPHVIVNSTTANIVCNPGATCLVWMHIKYIKNKTLAKSREYLRLCLQFLLYTLKKRKQEEEQLDGVAFISCIAANLQMYSRRRVMILPHARNSKNITRE